MTIAMAAMDYGHVTIGSNSSMSRPALVTLRGHYPACNKQYMPSHPHILTQNEARPSHRWQQLCLAHMIVEDLVSAIPYEPPDKGRTSVARPSMDDVLVCHGGLVSDD